MREFLYQRKKERKRTDDPQWHFRPGGRRLLQERTAVRLWTGMASNLFALGEGCLTWVNATSRTKRSVLERRPRRWMDVEGVVYRMLW